MLRGDAVEVRFVADPGGQLIGIQKGHIAHVGLTRVEVALPAMSGNLHLGVDRSWLKELAPGQWVLEQLSIMRA